MGRVPVKKMEKKELRYESTEVKKLAEVQFKWPKPKFEPNLNQIY